MKLYFGIDVGGTKLSAALVTGKGRILSRAKVSTPRAGGSRAVLEAVESLVRRVAAEGKVRVKDAQAAGAGLPGIIDARRGLVLNAPNIPLTGVPVAGKLKKLLKIPVAIGNDVNLGLLGEQWLGAGRGASDAVGLFPGTGVGGGVIAGGRAPPGSPRRGRGARTFKSSPPAPPAAAGTRAASSSLQPLLHRAGNCAGDPLRQALPHLLLRRWLALIKSKMIAKASPARTPHPPRGRAAAERLGPPASACATSSTRNSSSSAEAHRPAAAASSRRPARPRRGPLLRKLPAARPWPRNSATTP